MALIFKRKPVQLTAPAPETASAGAVPRASFFMRKSPGQSKDEVAEAPPVIKPKVVLKFGGSNATKAVSEVPTVRQQNNLIAAGLMAPEELKYPACHIGARVTITNAMFPWVKHYKPGDSGVVTMLSTNGDLVGDKTGGHKIHVIKIDQPLDKSRMGSTAALFRWEFEPYKGPVPAAQGELL